MTGEYILVAYEAYMEDTYLFTGTEEGLKEFIKNNTTDGALFNGRPYKGVKKVCGYYLDDLAVLIEGPDVRMYIE